MCPSTHWNQYPHKHLHFPLSLSLSLSPTLSLALEHAGWQRVMQFRQPWQPDRGQERANEERERERAPAFNVNATAGERGRAQSLALRKWEGESALQKELHIMLDNFRTKKLLKLCQRSKKKHAGNNITSIYGGRITFIASKCTLKT